MIRRFVPLVALFALAACSSSPAATPTTVSPPATTSAGATSTTSAGTTTTTSGGGTTTTVTAEEPAHHAATIDELLHLGRPIVLAHTGGEDNFPASTLFSYEESAKAGVDVLDINVLLTKDHQLLVQHDDTVNRNTNGTGKVADLTYAQINALDAAYWFGTACSDCHDKPAASYLYRGMRTGAKQPPAGHTADDFALPTLRMLVAKFPDYPLNIEIKGSGAAARAAADELDKELHDLHREKDTVVASFQDDIVSYFHRIAPDIEVSPGLKVMTDYVLHDTPIPDGMRILQLPPEYTGVQVLTPALIARANRSGYPIWVWPNDHALENYEHYMTFLDEGIPGLNINYPSEGVRAMTDFSARVGLRDKVPSPACSSGVNVTLPKKDPTLPFSAAGLHGIYLQHLPPSYHGDVPLPIVLDLHGWGEPASLRALESGLPAFGDVHRFITVEPDITRPVPLWDTSLGSADIAWIDALITHLDATLCIDTARVFVTGFSDGAMMTSSIACSLSATVAAVAPVSGVRDPKACAPTRHVPLLTFHGTADPFLAYTGGYGPKLATLPTPDGKGTIGTGVIAKGDDAIPVPDMVAGWATRNGCTGSATTATVAKDVRLSTWTCPADGTTELYTVVGGGHSWPGSAFDASIASTVGRTTTSIDADAIVWAFFEEHPLPK